MGFDSYKKEKDFLVCVDSDGCVMDTMDVKHKKCFGPALVDVFGLEEWRSAVLKRWDEINLYSGLRGVNRFKALALILREIDGRYVHIDGLSELEKWTRTADELSSSVLKACCTGPCAFRAVEWSEEVNRRISDLPEDEGGPFEGVEAAMKELCLVADTVVISSANGEAVKNEWEKYGLAKYVRAILTQEHGSKADCINGMRSCGYEADHVLMIGDAPGDLDAARSAGVLFYPVLVGAEPESWENLCGEPKSRFVGDSYRGEFEESLVSAFRKNLNL